MGNVDVFGSQFVIMNAVRFSGVHCRRTSSSKKIDLHRHGFEMIWVHALRNAAKMIQSQTFGDTPPHQNIHDSMRPLVLLLPVPVSR